MEGLLSVARPPPFSLPVSGPCVLIIGAPTAGRSAGGERVRSYSFLRLCDSGSGIAPLCVYSAPEEEEKTGRALPFGEVLLPPRSTELLAFGVALP